jgi:hypothetical protein
MENEKNPLEQEMDSATAEKTAEADASTEAAPDTARLAEGRNKQEEAAAALSDK